MCGCSLPMPVEPSKVHMIVMNHHTSLIDPGVVVVATH